MNTSLHTLVEHEVRIDCGEVQLEGDLVIPAGAEGLVIFAHGSGSSRLSPRNRLVAGEMHGRQLATLLFDLLTPQEAIAEARTGVLRFDIPFLTGRLVEATRWARRHEDLHQFPMGYFGSSTGAAAALAAAAILPEIKAVVSRGGRSDLAGPAVKSVNAATLLIAGGLDYPIIEWNQRTLEQLKGIKQFAIIPNASHLFEEADTLEKAAELAADWFALHLPHSASRTL